MPCDKLCPKITGIFSSNPMTPSAGKAVIEDGWMNWWMNNVFVHFMPLLLAYFKVIGGERPPWAVLRGHIHGWVGPQFRRDCWRVSMGLLHCHGRAVKTSDGPLTWRHSPGKLEISLPYHPLLRAAQLTAHISPLTRQWDVMGLRQL